MGEIDRQVMTMTSTTLAILFIVLAAVIGIWDVTALINPGTGETVSMIIFDWSKRFPFLPFLFGFIIGHLFFPLR